MEIISNNKTATNTVEVEFKASAEEFEQAALRKLSTSLSLKLLICPTSK